MMLGDTIESQEGAAWHNLSIGANNQETSTRGRITRG
jgi:hypothetical protein